FADPGLRVSVNGGKVSVHADAFAAGICIMDGDRPAVLADNFFSMEAGDRSILIEQEPENELRAVCVRDIAV
ncbi:MAG: hypothetical protein IK096_07870, partial [Lachnospiraceae bacterium]|nr:hypothetical protein [Lachnospiraceae bacterium]